MASIVWLDLDGNRYKSDEYSNIESFRFYIKKNMDNINVVELLDCNPLESLYDKSAGGSGLFQYCINLVEVRDVKGASKVKNMSDMFANCSSLERVPYLDTFKVDEIRNMFYRCPGLDYIKGMKNSKAHSRISEMYNYVWRKVE